jgi:hypothetical protein
MKLTTIALASILAATSSMALAAGTATGGTGGAATTGAAAGTAAMSNGNATISSSNGLNIGFSTGTYATLTTPGGMPSSVPAPGAVISR